MELNSCLRVVIADESSMPRPDWVLSLEREGCVVIRVGPVKQQLLSIHHARPDAIVIRRGDSHLDALELFKDVRASNIGCACVLIADRLVAHEVEQLFRAGGDDYLLAPIAARELAARLRVLLLRRAALPAPSAELDLGPLRVDTFQRVFLHEEQREMPKKELQLLLCLGRHANTVVTHAQLRALGWSSERPLGSNALEVHVSRLRRWLRDELGDSTFEISSMRGVGYTLTVRAPASAWAKVHEHERRVHSGATSKSASSARGVRPRKETIA